MKILKILSIILILTSCVTSPPDSFLITTLSDYEKSDIITRKGIALYEKELEKNENYSSIPEIMKHFNTALDFNPGNQTATNYIKKIENFTNRMIKKNIETAKSYLKKGRTEQDEFNACIYWQKANEIDSSNESVKDLKSEIMPIQRKLVDKYNTQGKESLSKAEKTAKRAEKEKLIVKSINQYGKTLLIESSNTEADLGKKNGQKTLAEMYMPLIEETKQLVSQKKYTKSQENIKKLKSNYNNHDAKTKKEISSLEYSLYYNWANYNFVNKNYELAEDRIWLALKAQKTKEGVALQKRIITAKNKAEVAQSFGNWISDIDDLINQREYAAASRKINRLLSTIEEPGKKAQLTERKNKLIAMVGDIYNKAVDDYTNENFDDAITGFETVIEIQEDYQNAVDYLDKARSKKKIMESY